VWVVCGWCVGGVWVVCGWCVGGCDGYVDIVCYIHSLNLRVYVLHRAPHGKLIGVRGHQICINIFKAVMIP
jgi:hypothetical protein